MRLAALAAVTASDSEEPVGDLAAWRAQREQAARYRQCPIGEHATQVVFGEGPLQARLMLAGEQPGDREDIEGHPFVGPAGRLLMRALAELGWPRDAMYLTNAVKHFKYELRGKRRMHKSDGRRVLVALHPSALLRGEPALRETACAAWLADLQRASESARR